MTIEKATVYNLKEKISYVENKIVNAPIIKSTCGRILIFAFDENQELREHTAPHDAVVQILEGSARICIEKNPFILKDGDVIILPANIPHAVYANTKMKMLLTMIKE